jgi:7-carboxy-7-deazaguanine synthase
VINPNAFPKTYQINEWFFSLQGEGMRAGTANLFLRFTGCNLKCNQEEQGFDCDTEFTSGRKYSLDEISSHLKECAPNAKWIILTGGEPTLQIDDALLDRLHQDGYKIAIETNGTRAVSSKIDWITVSPKTAEHAIKQLTANEVKYVRSFGMGIPKTVVKADHYLISPAFEGDQVSAKNLEWCTKLVKENPEWRLSIQMHKFWKVR